jgi:hypothetical protein
MDPSLSRDGKRMAFIRVYKPMIADGRARHRRPLETHQARVPLRPVMRPDGRAVMWGLGHNGASSALELCTARFDAPRRERCHGYFDGNYAWGPGGRLLLERWGVPCDFTSRPAGEWDARYCDHKILASREGTDGFESYAFSPDGRLLVASEDLFGDDHIGTRIAVFSVRTGRFVRELTHDHSDQRPVFSPDGRWVAFRRVHYEEADSSDTYLQVAELLRVRVGGGAPRTIVSKRRAVGPATWGG